VEFRAVIVDYRQPFDIGGADRLTERMNADATGGWETFEALPTPEGTKFVLMQRKGEKGCGSRAVAESSPL
jgi:hypothetical protein